MAGGLMQLVAYGAQDIYLTGNPQITFFKVVYRRHTNFAMEAIECTFNGDVGFGRKAVVPITRNGDLVTRMWLKTQLTKTAGEWVDNVGYALINSVELQIGGTKIDKHYGRWMHLWRELSSSKDHDISHQQTVDPEDNDADTINLFVPLQFFCCRNDGLALPLIALQYHDVRLEFNFGSVSDCGSAPTLSNSNNVPMAETFAASVDNASLLVEYIYLDSEERKRFAQASHEYLIEQVQHTGSENITGGVQRFSLSFNHPVKELVFAADVDNKRVLANEEWATYQDRASNNPVSSAILQLNGHDRFSEQSGKYFNYVQPHSHHSRTPSVGVNSYSFALNPEEHQPSGTCNFSRIDNASLNVSFNNTVSGGDFYIFAHSYNVLRIMSGMGGLAYSN